jgi:uncharacterized protein DUF3224
MKCLVALLSLTIGIAPSLGPRNEAVMTAHAKGTFDVKATPQPTDDPAGGPFGRLFLDKQFHGDLDAHSNGQMLAWGTGAESWGAGVALERVTGALHGRRGSFILQHNATIIKGVASMTVTVVPDSGTDELTGLAGKMTIIIAEGKHSYAFEYTLGAR